MPDQTAARLSFYSYTVGNLIDSIGYATVYPPPRATRTHAFPDSFADATRDLVQWLEDVGHEQVMTPGLTRALVAGARSFLAEVAWSYRQPAPDVRTSEAHGTLRLQIDTAADLAAVLRDCEPFLFAALNTPDGLCACQAVPGVHHNHI